MSALVLVDDKDYFDTLEILRGRKALHPVFRELKDWMKARFGVTAHNFVFREIPYDNPDRRYELCALLATQADCQSMFKGIYYDGEKIRELSGRFQSLAAEFRYCDPKRADAHVRYIDFSTEMKTDVNDRACRAAAGTLSAKYAPRGLWQICPAFAGTTVFYMTDEDVRKNESTGVSAALRAEYAAEILRQDEFGIFSDGSFSMSFDSKESLDRHYNGNLYFYFK